MLSTDVLHDVQVFSILAAIMHVRMDHPQHACSSVWSLVYASDTVCMVHTVHKVALDAHSKFMTHHALDTIHIIIFQRLLDALT